MSGIAFVCKGCKIIDVRIFAGTVDIDGILIIIVDWGSDIECWCKGVGEGFINITDLIGGIWHFGEFF